MPKYSFLLPAFKGRFLDEMLHSIQGQTYTDFKVIISDDCSPEDLKSICEPYLSDSRFTYRRNTENMGSKSLVSHWNLLVDMCDTEFLIMASDDDVYEPQFLEEIDELTLKHPTVNLFRGRSRCINDKRVAKFDENVKQEWMDNLHFIHRIYQEDWAGGIASFVYKTQSLKEFGMFVDFPAAWFSDDVTNFLMSNNGCCFTSDITFCVRTSDIQISGQWGDLEDSKKKITATIMNYNWMKNYMVQFQNYEDKKLLADVLSGYKKKIYSNIQNYIYSCDSDYFFKHVFQCPSDIGLSKPRMIAHYLRIKLNL